jgi:hypothetical protein
MRNAFLLLALAGLLASTGCSSSDDNGSSGSGSTGTSGSNGGSGGSTGSESPTVAVSGTVQLNPIVAAAYDGGLLTGSAPAFSGQTLFIDEPLIATAQGVEEGRLATVSLDGSGTFNVPSVPTDSIVIGLVATIAGDSPDGGFTPCDVTSGAPSFCDGYARSVSLVYENLKPTADVTGVPIYGVPVAFTELLASKLGEAEGQHLLDRGFVLGYVVGADGQPVAGATFDRQGVNYDVEYLDDDLNPGGTATNKYGMFLIIAPGQPDASKKFGITGHPEFNCHRVGSNPGTVLSLIYDANRPGISCQ